MSKVLLAIVIVALLGLGYMSYTKRLTVDPQAPPAIVTPNTLTIPLSAQNDSGETGTAVLSEENGKVTVKITTLNYPKDTPQPAHIHLGSCPEVGAVKYPLTSLVNGSSETILNVTLDTLKNEVPLALNVHKSAAEAKVYTACGDLTF
jgi:hypothetical protein